MRMMTFFAIHVLSDATLVFAHYFVGVGTEEEDRFEAKLATTLSSCPVKADQLWVSNCLGYPVLGRVHQGLLFLLSGSKATDELLLAEYVPLVIDIVVATCDNKLTAAQVQSSHGKITACFHSAAPQGRLAYTDVHTILRNAKLKAPAF